MTTLVNSSWLEWVWLIASILVTIFSLAATRESMLDQATLIAAGVNGHRQAAAENNIRQELIRLLIAVVMNTAAGASVMIPDVVESPPSYKMQVRLLAWIFIAVLMGIGTWFDRSMRRKIMQTAPVSYTTSSAQVPAPIAAKNPLGAAVAAAKDARADDAATAAAATKPDPSGPLKPEGGS